MWFFYSILDILGVMLWDSRSYLNLVYLPSLILCHGGRGYFLTTAEWRWDFRLPTQSPWQFSHWVWKGCLCFPLDFHLVLTSTDTAGGKLFQCWLVGNVPQSAFSSITSLQPGGNPSVASTDTVGRGFWLLGEDESSASLPGFSDTMLAVPYYILARVES